MNSLLIAQQTPGKVNSALIKSVVKIERLGKGNSKYAHGTGFIVSRPMEEDENVRQFFLVTNKHVVGDWNAADKNIENFQPVIFINLYTNGFSSSGKFYSKGIELIEESSNMLSDKIKLHPDPIVDVVIIDVTEEINDVHSELELDLASFDTSFLARFDEIYSEWEYGIGDQVFALGYPMGISSSNLSLPIAKSVYLASLPGELFQIDLNWSNRKKKVVKTTLKGKLLIVDGLIVGGNSGGPVVLPSGVRFKYDADKGFQHSVGQQKNLVIGIVSSSIGSSGINIVYSSDYILDLINAL